MNRLLLHGLNLERFKLLVEDLTLKPSDNKFDARQPNLLTLPDP
jgi:hypothetical protein